MRRTNKPKNVTITYDGTVEKNNFCTCIAAIIGDEKLAEALFNGFEKSNPKKLTFKEYAAGVGIVYCFESFIDII